MRKYMVLVMMVLLPAAGALIGGVAGPSMARTNYTVRVARRIKVEEERKLEDRTLESEAFREADGSVASLYERARDVQGRFRIGGVLFGAWCGVVLGLRFFVINREERRTIYDINQFRCVACTRCYLSCPREHLRLRELNPAYRRKTESPMESERGE